MTDETRALPTSADIEAIRQRAHAGSFSQRDVDDLLAMIQELAMDAVSLSGQILEADAVLDGERRHRADLEREIGEARGLLERLTRSPRDWELVDRMGFEELTADARAFLARQVVQEAETP